MSHMEREIVRQFGIWPELPPICASRGPWLMVGCGSSFHVADVAARRLRLRGAKAWALAASELVAFPEMIPPDSHMIALSRSGETSELMWAVASFRAHTAGEVWGISCQRDSSLLREVDHPICLAAAKEEAVVMTGAFNATLWALDHLTGYPPDVQAQGQAVVDELAETIPDWAIRGDWRQVVFLGSGPLFPMAREGALKLTESALEAAEAYLTLEVRHGPKARFGSHTLVVILGSRRQHEAEMRLIDDLEALQTTVWRLEPTVREIDLAYVYAPQLQWLALERARFKGLDPDRPTQLTRHVALD